MGVADFKQAKMSIRSHHKSLGPFASWPEISSYLGLNRQKTQYIPLSNINYSIEPEVYQNMPEYPPALLGG